MFDDLKDFFSSEKTEKPIKNEGLLSLRINYRGSLESYINPKISRIPQGYKIQIKEFLKAIIKEIEEEDNARNQFDTNRRGRGSKGSLEY